MKQTLKLACALGIILVFCGTGLAEGEDTKSATKPVKEASHLYTLQDGSAFLGKLNQATISVKTKYGTLQVPLGDIVSINPGLHSQPEFAQRISRLIEELGADGPDGFKVREAAQIELSKEGLRIRPFLEKYADSDDAEQKTRITTILEQFDEMEADAEDDGEAVNSAALIEDDRIETIHFTIVGRVQLTQFSVKTNYGSLMVKFEDVRQIARVGKTLKPTSKNVTITGKDFAGMSWKSSGVRINRGDRVTIIAKGKITMSPWGSSKFSTPDGVPSCGWYLQDQIPYGMLCMTIGSGQPEKVGTRTSFVAKKSGVLKLGFAMTSNYGTGTRFPGEYKVRIKVTPKL